MTYMRAVGDDIEEKLGPVTHEHSPSVLYKIGQCPCIVSGTYNISITYIYICVIRL
jgi:anti-sigma factor ChrR (cupin superfamily)